MKLSGVFVRFTGLYLLIKIAAAVVLALFDLKSNSGAAVVSIILATRMSCDSFTKKNGAFFSKEEFRKVVFGFALINMMFAAAAAYLVLTSASIKMTSIIMVALFIEVGLLHTAGIYFMVRISGRQFEKRMAMDAYNNQVQIYSTSVLSEAQIIKEMMESHGIPCDIRTEERSNANITGDIPLVMNASLWISDKSKRHEAMRLLEEYENATTQDVSSSDDTPWSCASCGQESEAHFTSCWNCGGLKLAE